MALGGVTAALGVVVMALGGIIPFATFVCPVIAMLILSIVVQKTNWNIAVAWYGTVAILSLLLSPDKEAASMFLFLGYYPMIKPILEKSKLQWMLKVLLFNAAVLLMYFVLINIVGLQELVDEQKELGVVMTVVTLLLGNFTFFMLDRLLDKLRSKIK